MQRQIKPGPRPPLGLVGVLLFKFSDGAGHPRFLFDDLSGNWFSAIEF